MYKKRLKMTMPRKIVKSNTITVEDYYTERFLHIETELRHQRELMKMGFDTMNKRFEEVEKRFEAIDKRFEAVDKRFDAITLRMDRFMVWSFGMTLTSSGIIIAAMKYWR